MSESITGVPDASVDSATPAAPPCVGPPPTERPAEVPIDPRAELLRMAAALSRTRNDRLLAEYLRLRRAAR